ncbi:hypothetical protein AB0C13_39070 [Streptomyces sp. NPDC049099]|uniref:hypothetical protein n=1 Tax=Streptomyces sp. NPDC049099 TaxID=3155768 RepID=UPI00344953CE
MTRTDDVPSGFLEDVRRRHAWRQRAVDHEHPPQMWLKLRSYKRLWRKTAGVMGMDWGTVPAWVSAIGTSGSLLMGFHILLRDRKKEERQEANKVICWLDPGPHQIGQPDSYTISVLNASERPISNVFTLIKHPKGKMTSERVAPVIRAGEEVTCEQTLWDGEAIKFGVCFEDADGTQWVRDVLPDTKIASGFGPGVMTQFFGESKRWAKRLHASDAHHGIRTIRRKELHRIR